jgi:integrase
VRAGPRIQEVLALAEHDLDDRRGSLLVRNGKGGRRREVGMDDWGWEQVRPWLNACGELPVGRPSAPSTARLAGDRGQEQPFAASSGVSRPRRVSGAGSRRISCVMRMRSGSPVRGVALNIIQRQLGHANLGTTSIYLQGNRPRGDHYRRAHAARR